MRLAGVARSCLSSLLLRMYNIDGWAKLFLMIVIAGEVFGQWLSQCFEDFLLLRNGKLLAWTK